MGSQTILLDTHVWLWLNLATEKIPPEIFGA